MSGGHYNYQSSRVNDLAYDIEQDAQAYAIAQTIDGRVREAEPPDIIEAMAYCARELKRLAKLAHDIEWYMSADYGPESVREAHALALGMPTDQQIIALAKATQTAEGGTDGYILPVSFARELLNQYVNRKD